MPLDIFARRAHYIDHLAPVWHALPPESRGRFFVPPGLEEHAAARVGPGHLVLSHEVPEGTDPILVAGYGDLFRAARRPRPLITMEHGTGHAFGRSAYPDGRGVRETVSLCLMPNEYTARRVRAVRTVPCPVIGTPKMDEWVPDRFPTPAPSGAPVLAVAFHWGERATRPPESGSAFDHYREILPALAKRYTLLGHGHPLAKDRYRTFFEEIGVEWVPDFGDILRRADLYLNDLSSTLYEFVVTGKPVVVLNAPWFRRSVSWGIRFWDYADVGLQVDEPAGLFAAIDETLAHYETLRLEERRQAVADLYPYPGCAAARAAAVLVEFLETACTPARAS